MLLQTGSARLALGEFPDPIGSWYSSLVYYLWYAFALAGIRHESMKQKQCVMSAKDGGIIAVAGHICRRGKRCLV